MNASRPVRRWLAALLLLIAGCALPGSKPAATGWQAVALGLCEDYPEETRSLERARADLAAARAAGATVLRISFGWDAMEPERGRYDWSFWDEFVAMATQEFDLRLIPYVCYTPRWAAIDPGENFWRSPPRDPADFGRFMRALVSRYRHAIRSWELWNEPDNRAYWLGTPTEFARLVRAGSEGVRSADPRASIVLGGIATELGFLEQLFETERVAPFVDVVNLHTYFETWHPDPIESLPAYVARAKEIVQEHGENEPLWLAETGYSSVGPRAKVSDVYRAHFQGEHTAEAQAAALVRTVVLALSTRQLPLVAWYRINDLPGSETVIGDDNNRHLGLRTAAGEPKPAFAAFAQLTRTFNQRLRPQSLVVETLMPTQSAAPGIEAHGFILEDGRRVVAAWLGRPPPDTETAGARSDPPPDAEPAADTRGASLRIRLPGFTASRVRTRDALGQAWPAERTRWETGAGGSELHLRLKGGEVALCVLEP